MKKILIIITFLLYINNCNALENISINNVSLSPVFDKNIKVYNAFVSEDKEIITINVVSEENEIITGSGSISLKKGLNENYIMCYKNDVLIDKYILNIVRGDLEYREDDSFLKNLIIEGYDINFDKNNYYYEISDVKEDRINLYYERENPLSVVKVSGDVILKKEENIIKIEVTSENKNNKSTYIIKVLKKINNVLKESSEKEYSDFELKVIRIIIISIILTIIIIMTYFTFKRKKS